MLNRRGAGFNLPFPDFQQVVVAAAKTADLQVVLAVQEA